MRFVYCLDVGPVPVASWADCPTLSITETAAISGWSVATLAGFHRLIRWAFDNDVTGEQLAELLEQQGGDHG